MFLNLLSTITRARTATPAYSSCTHRHQTPEISRHSYVCSPPPSSADLCKFTMLVNLWPPHIHRCLANTLDVTASTGGLRSCTHRQKGHLVQLSNIQVIVVSTTYLRKKRGQRLEKTKNNSGFHHHLKRKTTRYSLSDIRTVFRVICMKMEL